jgi:Tfp pilus assembly protein PilZ
MLLKKIFPVPFRKLPIPILLIGVYFLLTPVVSYFATAASLNVPAHKFDLIFQSFTPRSIGLNLLGFFLGFGILGVKRWGYVLFLLFNFLLIAHGVYLLIQFGFEDQFLWNLIITVIPFFLILYFLNKEISTPYLTLVPRGFRSKWRIAIPLSGTLTYENQKMSIVTMDISPSGCLASVDGKVPEDKTFTVQFDLAGHLWETEATYVREEDGNIGIKFELFGQERKRKQLDKFLSTFLLPRYVVTTLATIQKGNQTFQAEVVNISEGGAYIATTEKCKEGDLIEFQMKLYGVTFRGKGKISWENPEGKYEKPAGYGFSFKEINAKFLYSLLIFFYEKINSFQSRDR